MNWEIKLAKRVSKEMKHIPKKDAKRLLFVLERLTENPYHGDIEKIRSEDNLWRRRMGNYRIIYKILSEQKYIEVFDIRRRTTTTYRKQ